VTLPVEAPLEPMLAKRADTLPEGDGWMFEPKWDGFRTLVFRDGASLMLQSRDKKPLNRYFPELEAPLLEQLPERAVLDGEIVVARGDALDFEALQLRVHPASSRVKMLAEELPASIVVWDLLCLGDDDLRAVPFAERRAALERALGTPRPPLYLTPLTRDVAVAADWFRRFEGAGLDGVMAKRAEGGYEPGKRVMLKVKHQRTADCVVAGFRWHKNGPGTLVGSLLLGLYDDAGVLHHIGVTASFPAARRKALVAELEPYREGAAADHPWAGWMDAMEQMQRRPGGHSRWNRGKTMEWEPLRPELVCEVTYDHMQGRRLRHTAQFLRWRSDKPARDCRYDQLETTPPYEVRQIFASQASE
jgi:ATP-dependent DNA ligase